MNYAKLIQKSQIDNYSKKSNRLPGYNGKYSMHKYWSKKPADLIRDLILQYTKKGEIVLDPFSGSGVTIAESLFTNRKTIGIDLNPAAIRITKQLIEKTQIEKTEKTFSELEKKCEEKINSIYRVRHNGKTITGLYFLWDANKLKKIHYRNGKVKHSIIKAKRSDQKLAKSFSYKKIRYFYPTSKLIPNSRINVEKNLRACDLFTPRNTYALAFLLHQINKIKNPRTREFFRFCFSAVLGQTSKMVFVIKRRGKMNSFYKQNKSAQIGSWIIGYWRPKEFFEANVWHSFKLKYKKILKAKKLQMKQVYEIKPAKKFSQMKKCNLLLVNQSSLKVLPKLPSNSIDYIILDPPHTDRIPYLELSKMWNDWLKQKPNYNDELKMKHNYSAIEFKKYLKLLSKIINEIERVLKPRRHISFIFNNSNEKSWGPIINLFDELKLQLIKKSKMNYSLNSVVQTNRVGGLKLDYVLTYKKK